MKIRSSFLASLVVLAGVILLSAAQSHATVIESWEGSADGWTINAENGAYSIDGAVTSPGVTNGSYSLSVTGTGAPTYGQMLNSPSTLANTAILANAATISIDIYTPPGSFGFFQQWLLAFDNADTGYTQIPHPGDYYASTTIGSETTLTFPVPASVNAALAASTNPTKFIWQVGGGYSSFNETFNVDNMAYTAVPEPASLSLLGLGGFSLVGMAIRRRRS